MRSQTYTPTLFRLVPLARAFRKNPTPSEALLWEQLRMRRLDGVRFRRQHPFECGAIVDFYAPCHKLVVEVDGGVHYQRGAAERDARRQAVIERAYGVRFVRVPVWIVERDMPRALAMIRAAVR